MIVTRTDTVTYQPKGSFLGQLESKGSHQRKKPYITSHIRVAHCSYSDLGMQRAKWVDKQLIGPCSCGRPKQNADTFTYVLAFLQ